MTGQAGTLFLTADDTDALLSWPDMIAALRAAYSPDLDAKMSPPRVVARGNGAWLRALAAIPPSGRFMGSKVFGFSRSRNVSYLITLFDQETAEVVALIDGNSITALRTAATSALAIDLMAPKQIGSVAVLGSGSEAKAHIRAAAAVRTFSEVRVFSPTPVNRNKFAAELNADTGIVCHAAASARDAVEGADLVIAAARSHNETPILEGAWLKDGMSVVSIGSTLPEQREIDPQTVEVCDLIVSDMPDEVAEETGDMLAARAAGVEFESKMVSLNDLVRGGCADRVKAARLPMFKSVGAAIQDIAVAELAFRQAASRNIGTRLPISFREKRG